MATPTTDPDPGTKRKTLSVCFEEARERFRTEHQSACRQGTPKREEFDRFLQGTSIGDLEQVCKDLGNQAEEKVNNASRLWSTLDMLKTTGDAFIDFAPESVSMVWFGISSLIQVGNAKLQTRLLICGTCDSIANIIIDCMRWEARMSQSDTDDSTPKLEIWESEVPELIFSILDFLWSAKPHFDQSRLKRLGTTLKDLFTKDIQQKVDSLLEKYQEIVRIAQVHFEECLLNDNLRTGTKLQQIIDNVGSFASIGSELIDAVNRQALLEELNHKKNKIKLSDVHKTHIKALNDNLTRIMKQRNGQFVAGWLFKEDAYVDWKSQSTKTSILYIKGPRGHGKSVAMMSVSRALSEEESIICHFFFKKGEQEIQQSRTALEALLYQLLDSNQVRNNIAVLTNVVFILNPGFGDPDNAGSDAFMSSLDSLSEAIRKVSETMKERVYLFIDALDECQDRREQNFAKHLLSIVATKPDALRIIFSARSNIDVLDELPSQPEELKVIEITAEKNSTDLEVYLRHDVGGVLNRRIDSSRFPKFFNTELTRIPSKESLETKIQRLPASIGDIYMASLESLAPDEQEFVVVFLKWVVWSTSGVTVIEISDHYREIYKDKPLRGPSQSNGYGSMDDVEEVPQVQEYDPEIRDLIANDPYEDPDIKDVIHHLENAGRDFFKVDRTTGVVSVDISIREWIQDDPNSKLTILESRGFHRSRDQKGNTVFQFTLTPSFVRYGDSLNELFVKREAHMSVTIDILRALNNISFQDKYMLWPEYTSGGVGDDNDDDDDYFRDNYEDDVDSRDVQRPRYEVRHWQDHIKVLQSWWNGISSLDDSWWTELLTQISIFIKPENLQRWGVQVPNVPEYYRRRMTSSRKITHLQSSFQQPIHVACMHGLPLIIDYIMRVEQKGTPSFIKSPPQDMIAYQTALDKRVSVLRLTQHWWDEGRYGKLGQMILKNMSSEETETFLIQAYGIDKDSEHGLAKGLVDWILSNLNSDVIISWLALGESRDTRPAWFYPSLESLDVQEIRNQAGLDMISDLEKKVQAFVTQYRNDKAILMSKFTDFITDHCSKNHSQSSILDVTDLYGRLPLYIAAKHPKTVKCLIEYGADANKIGRGLKRSAADKLELPLLSILWDLIDWEDVLDEKTVQSLLQSASILLPKTANLEKIKDKNDSNLLHLAARIGNLDFFKLLCLSGRWNIHVKDKNGDTPMHYLFQGQRLNNKKKIEDVLEICMIISNMKQSNGEDLVNAQNIESRSPLALAVAGYWIEAVRLLIDLGADPHDDDVRGYNCFHVLASAANPHGDESLELQIAQILFDAGVDCAKRGRYGDTPLALAVQKPNKLHIVDFLVQKYIECGHASRGKMDIFSHDSDGSNILHLAVPVGTHGAHFRSIDDLNEDMQYFGKLIQVLLNNGIHAEDIQGLLRQADSSQKLPIDVALRYENLPAIQEILSISPELKSSGQKEGETLLTHASISLVKFAEDGSEDSLTDLNTKFVRKKNIINYFLDAIPAISLTIFESSLFDPKSTVWRQLDLDSISLHYGAPFKDSSGWGLVDILTHLKRESFIDALQLKKEDISPPRSILRPSRIKKVVKSFGELSGNGLEYSVPGAKPNTEELRLFNESCRKGDYPRNRTTVIADHPVPPGNPFYFEVKVSKHTSEYIAHLGVKLSDPSGVEIGFETLGSRFPEAYSAHHKRETTGWKLTYKEEFRPVFQDLQLKPEADTHCIGCGLDPLQSRMFQTYNGAIQKVLEFPAPLRCTPEVRMSWDYGDLKANFGAAPFQFELANSPDWIWDDRILDGFDLIKSTGELVPANQGP
ncbi:hypothetical protein TWF718_007629 [Orbilia javanica]|uniref:Nephrocystin 3-like N-terminal domain-containing protein n=1 Tax=Orbilia javanica TaxID=47235 RepID=A0AAN8N775_9PEZI